MIRNLRFTGEIASADDALEVLEDSAQIMRAVAGLIVAVDDESICNAWAGDSLELLRGLMLCASDAVAGAAAALR